MSNTVQIGKGPFAVVPFLPAARKALAVVAGLAFVNAILLSVQAFLFASALARIVSDGNIGGNFLRYWPELRTTVLWLIAIVILRAGVSWLTRVVSARAAVRAKEKLREQVTSHVLELGPEWINKRGPGELTALVTKGLDSLDAYFTVYLPALVTAVVIPVIAGTAILSVDWISAGIVLITIPLLPMFAILVGKYTADKISAATDSVHRLSGYLLETLRALPVLTAFRRADAQVETVRKISDRHRVSTLATLRVALSSAFVLELAATLSVALVAVFIGMRLVSGDLSLAIGLGVLLLVPECYQPIRAVGAAFHASEDGIEAVRRVLNVVAEPTRKNGNIVPLRGEIRIEKLSVSRRDILAPNSYSVSIQPGDITHLSAPSGFGKSTIFSVLLGFTSVLSGKISISGTPLMDLDIHAWRRCIAWVPQQPIFGGDSVRNELALALADRSDELASELVSAEIEKVLAQLEIDDIAERAIDSLSTGQRQRVAFARALLRVNHGAWLLLLDEPTAHLDELNAAKLRGIIEDLRCRGIAIVVAAHDSVSATTKPIKREKDERHNSVELDDSVVQRKDLLPLRQLLSPRLMSGACLSALAFLAGIALTATSAWLIAKASYQPPILTLTVAVVGVRAFGLGRAAARYVERIVTHDAAFRAATTLRERMWKALVRRGPAYGSSAEPDDKNENHRRLVDDADTIRDVLPRSVAAPIAAFIASVVAVIVQFIILPAAGIALAAAVLAGIIAVPLVALLTERRATTEAASHRRVLATKTMSLLDSSAELISVGAQRQRRSKLSSVDSQLTNVLRRQAFGSGVADALIILLLGTASIVSMWCAITAVTSSELAPVLAPVIVLLPLALIDVLGVFPSAAQHWDTFKGARRRIFRLVDSPQHLPAAASSIVDRLVDSGRVHMHHAVFSWPTAKETTLSNVNIDIPPGTWVALVGESGSGKSTLLAAILGFLTPQSGAVTIPQQCSWVPQEPRLVSTTVAENLRLAKPGASDDDMAEVLRDVRLADLDMATRLGNAGSGLSGGQANRLALARALLATANAEVVLLDEPTAHLDHELAQHIWTMLKERVAGRTVVYATHNPDELAHADIVLEVADKRVIQHDARQFANLTLNGSTGWS